ncbi:MAG: phosphatidate cytidylyltransferase [Oligosphaeraceae bacterium]
MLRDRLKVAIPLLCVVFAAFFLPGVWGRSAFAALAAAMLFTANHEGVLLCGFSPWKKEEILLDVYAVTLVANSWGGWGLDGALLMLFVLAAFALHFSREVTRQTLDRVAGILLVGLLVCWSLSFLAGIFYGRPEGPMLMAYLVVVTKIADIGAYLLGSLTARLPGGNHKLSPHVSPKKSWEGLLGGILFSVVASLLFLHFRQGLLPGGCLGGVLFGVLAATLGLLGDLCESLWKRAAGAKDSGKVPGLGGVLDMMDSLLPMGVALHFYLQLLG